jgi:hypothetical protein
VEDVTSEKSKSSSPKRTKEKTKSPTTPISKQKNTREAGKTEDKPSKLPKANTPTSTKTPNATRKNAPQLSPTQVASSPNSLQVPKAPTRDTPKQTPNRQRRFIPPLLKKKPEEEVEKSKLVLCTASDFSQNSQDSQTRRDRFVDEDDSNTQELLEDL